MCFEQCRQVWSEGRKPKEASEGPKVAAGAEKQRGDPMVAEKQRGDPMIFEKRGEDLLSRG